MKTFEEWLAEVDDLSDEYGIDIEDYKTELEEFWSAGLDPEEALNELPPF